MYKPEMIRRKNYINIKEKDVYMRRLLWMLLVLVFVFVQIGTLFLFADSNEFTANIFGKEYKIMDQPKIIGNYMLFPLRDLFELQGFDVAWKGDVGEISCKKENLEVVFDIDSSVVRKGNLIIDHNKHFQFINGKALISLDLLKDILNVNVTWDKARSILFMNDIEIEPYSWVEDNMLIAHALGGIHGERYTNSYDALKENYRNGYRVFEADLILTYDDNLVLRHDWSESFGLEIDQDIPKDKIGSPLTTDEFKELKIYKYLEPMDIKDFIIEMSLNKDIYLVTDTKETKDQELIKKQFSVLVNTAKEVDERVLQRIIPQIYNEEMYYVIKEIYNFDSIIYTLYAATSTNERILDFVSENDIKVVTIPPFRIRKAFIESLRDKGVYVYTHTINSMYEINEYKNLGIYGFYTDFITPDYLNRLYTKDQLIR